MTEYLVQIYLITMVYLVWKAPYIWQTPYAGKSAIMWEIAVVVHAVTWPYWLWRVMSLKDPK